VLSWHQNGVSFEFNLIHLSINVEPGCDCNHKDEGSGLLKVAANCLELAVLSGVHARLCLGGNHGPDDNGEAVEHGGETLRALFRGAEFVLTRFGGSLGHKAEHGKARKAYSSEEKHLAKRGKASLVTEHLFVVLKHVVEEGN